MKSFILVSFAFLAVVFYQMSGGANFEPRVETIPLTASIKVPEAQPISKPDQVQAASLIARPAVTSIVTSIATGLATVTVAKPPLVTFVQPGNPVVETAVARVQDTPAVSDTSPFAQPLVLVSLEQGLAGLTSPEPVAATPEPVVVSQPSADIREITATRVNMRDGPGTIYPVLARLSLGNEVEVLDTPGNGWLRLRTLSDQRVGWIAASLVSKPSQ